LTANALSGMKEMFLEKGFNDYLTKPIDVARLDEVLERWIPKARQKKGAANKDGKFRSQYGAPKEENNLVIPGLDVQRGIAMTGGALDGYRKILGMFRKDALERLPLLQSPPDPADLQLFTTQVHALKSAAASIGAAEVPEEAARLEAAGKAALAGSAEDMAVIREYLPGFAAHIAELAEEIEKSVKKEEIEKSIKKVEREGGHEGSTGSITAPMEMPYSSFSTAHLLRNFVSALEARKTDDIDHILEELLRQEADSARKEILEQISDNILMAEYETALETLKKLTPIRSGV
jgi:HPt (histidine-containing phosphotransfer) domain-containing protein